MTMERETIIQAKQRLYDLLLEMSERDMTADDQRIGDALAKDSEIQTVLSKEATKEAVRELYFWQRYGGSATNFPAMLYDLISKADFLNKESLREGFPTEVAVWEAWQHCEDEEKFFETYGFGQSKEGK